MFKVYSMAINMNPLKRNKEKEVYATQLILQKSKVEGPLDDSLIANNLLLNKKICINNYQF